MVKKEGIPHGSGPWLQDGGPRGGFTFLSNPSMRTTTEPRSAGASSSQDELSPSETGPGTKQCARG